MANRARAKLRLLIGALVLLALAPGPAHGERTQRGNLIVAVAGNISPLQLPRHRPAPVTLSIGGRIATADGSPLPRMKRIRLVIAGRGVLSTAGLPVCPRARLRNASPSLAMQRCGPALVGRGRMRADAFIGNQTPFPIGATLLAFNGRARGGGPAAWVHAFSANPPLAIVLPFIVKREGRRLQTSLTATVPAALGDLPHLASFELTLHRRYRASGVKRSYLSASCPAPAGFTAGYHGDRVFPLPVAHPLRASWTGREAAMKLSTETPLDPDRFAATAPSERPNTAGGPPDSPGGEIRAPDTWTG